MRIAFEEPTGVWVQGADGEAVVLTFPAFIAAVEGGTVAPDDQVWSRIVTEGRWVRAGEMRLFQMLSGQEGQEAALPEAAPEVWPPPIKQQG